jgi:hypothetical protein
LSEAEKIGKDFKAKPKQTIKDFLSWVAKQKKNHKRKQLRQRTF